MGCVSGDEYVNVIPGNLNSPGTLEWCRNSGAIEGLCAVLIRLPQPNCAPAVELVTGRHQYGQLSVTMPPYIRQHGQLQNDQCPQHALLHTAQVPVTICNLQLSQFKDTGEHSVSAQESNPLMYLLWPLKTHLYFLVGEGWAKNRTFKFPVINTSCILNRE